MDPADSNFEANVSYYGEDLAARESPSSDPADEAGLQTDLFREPHQVERMPGVGDDLKALRNRSQPRSGKRLARRGSMLCRWPAPSGSARTGSPLNCRTILVAHHSD
jgi:hypothetical protein